MSVDQATLPDDISQAVGVRRAPSAPRRLSLRANSSWMLGGNAVYAACQWAMLMVLARLGTPAMVGQFVLALAVTTPVMVFFMLQLRAVQATDARRLYTFGDYLALRLGTSALAIFVAAGICVVFGYGGETGWVILAAALSAAIDSVSDIIYGFFQQHERLDRMAQSMILKGAISLVILSAIVFATGQVSFGVLGIAASRLLVCLFWDLRNARLLLHSGAEGCDAISGQPDGLRPNWNAATLWALTVLSLPLGVAMMLIVLSTNIPRYFVEQWLGEHALGIFGALAYLGMVGTMAVGALGESATPQLAQSYAAGDRRAFAVLLAKLMGIGAVLGTAGVLVAWLIGRPVLAILYGPEYAAESGLLIWTMVAAGITYVASFTGYAVTAARYFRIQTPLFVAIVAVTAGACFWLVPAYGLFGAALAMCVTALAQLVGRCLILWHALMAERPDDAKPESRDYRAELPTPSRPCREEHWRDASGTRLARHASDIRSTPAGNANGIPTDRSLATGVLSPRKRHSVWLFSVLFVGAVLCWLAVGEETSGSDRLMHWFLIPVALCGILISVDVFRWLFGELDTFDPIGIVGLFGVHFFLLAPLLHVAWNYWIGEVVPPAEWRDWLGGMAVLNLLGLLAYRVTVAWSGAKPGERSAAVTWQLDPVRFRRYVTWALVVAAVLQIWVYSRFGGIWGYIKAVQHEEHVFLGIGRIITIAESFPILAMMAYAVYTWGRKRPSWLTLTLVLVVFLVLKMLFGGLYGSRNNIIFAVFWAVGIIHFGIRPVSRKLVLGGVLALVPFLYLYGFYKSDGVEGLVQALSSSEARANEEARIERPINSTILGDLGRSDVHAFLLHRMMQPNSDYEYAWGRTYVGGVLVLLPGPLWRDRPPGKLREGTEALYGRGTYRERALSSVSAKDRYVGRTSRLFGIAGEAMLNFGPLAVPVALALFGLGVGWVHRRFLDWDRQDVRRLLLPFLVNLCLMLLLLDSDNVVTMLEEDFLVPLVILAAASTRCVCGMASRGSDGGALGTSMALQPEGCA